MSALSIAVMAVVLLIVWGGFLYCLVLALRKEANKTGEAGGGSRESGRGGGD